MAIGPVVLNHRDNEGDGVTIAAQARVTSGANYTTGGSVITAAQLGLNYVTAVICDNLTQDGIHLLSVDRTALAAGPVTSFNVLAWSALNTQVSAAADLSAVGKNFGFEVQGY